MFKSWNDSIDKIELEFEICRVGVTGIGRESNRQYFKSIWSSIKGTFSEEWITWEFEANNTEESHPFKEEEKDRVEILHDEEDLANISKKIKKRDETFKHLNDPTSEIKEYVDTSVGQMKKFVENLENIHFRMHIEREKTNQEELNRRQ